MFAHTRASALHLLTNLCLRNERAFQQRMWRLFERKNEKEMKETKEKDKDQQKESHGVYRDVLVVLSHCLEPQTTICKWMFGETTIFYKQIWNHSIETTIYNSCLWFQVDYSLDISKLDTSPR